MYVLQNLHAIVWKRYTMVKEVWFYRKFRHSHDWWTETRKIYNVFYALLPYLLVYIIGREISLNIYNYVHLICKLYWARTLYSRTRHGRKYIAQNQKPYWESNLTLWTVTALKYCCASVVNEVARAAGGDVPVRWSSRGLNTCS